MLSLVYLTDIVQPELLIYFGQVSSALGALYDGKDELVSVNVSGLPEMLFVLLFLILSQRGVCVLSSDIPIVDSVRAVFLISRSRSIVSAQSIIERNRQRYNT